MTTQAALGTKELSKSFGAPKPLEADEARAMVAYALQGARGRNFINRKIIEAPAAPIPT